MTKTEPRRADRRSFRLTLGLIAVLITLAAGMPFASGAKADGSYLTSATSVSAGESTACAIRKTSPTDDAGQAVCWGYNAYGYLGNGSTTSSDVPVAVKGVDGADQLTGVTAINVGSRHTCAILEQGPDGQNQAVCWGENYYGGLGNGTNTSSNIPVKVKGVNGTGQLTGVTAISTGNNGSCAILERGPDGEDQTVCWGYNAYGQLGNNTDTNSNVPVKVKGTGAAGHLTETTEISVGNLHACAILGEGSDGPDQTVCWGFNAYGQLGNNTNTNSNVPVKVKGTGGAGHLTETTEINAGVDASCAIVRDGPDGFDQTVCWGANGNRQLGDGTTKNSNLPVPVKGVDGTGQLIGATAVTVGDSHTCAVLGSGPDGPKQTICWGRGLYGALGTGTDGSSNVPVKVKGTDGAGQLTEVTAISAGYFRTCAILGRGLDGPDQTVCWGWNRDGQLGNGDEGTDSSVPVKVLRGEANPMYLLVATQSGDGEGTLSSSPAGIDCGAVCEAEFRPDQLVTLVANPVAGSVFVGWSGACSGVDTCLVTMDQVRQVTATFERITHRVDVATAGSGHGTVVSVPAGIDCGTECDSAFDEGTEVTLTATPEPGSTFTGWSGACTGQANRCVVTMDEAREVTANFTALHQLTVTKPRPGQGKVISTPGGIDCGTECSAEFEQGTEVMLSAAPEPGYTFTGWTGDCSGSALDCTMTMDQARQVTATFERITHRVDVATAGSGHGTVVSVPAGIDCGTECDSAFDEGTEVTLTATPEPGSTFTGWSGACTGQANRCVVTMDEAREVTASFELVPEPIKPTKTVAVFDGTKLHVRLKCPARFKPACRAVAVPVTGKGRKSKPMAKKLRRKIGAGKWMKVAFKIKPKFRARVAKMGTKPSKLLWVRLRVHSRKIGKKRFRGKARTVRHRYRVRSTS